MRVARGDEISISATSSDNDVEQIKLARVKQSMVQGTVGMHGLLNSPLAQQLGVVVEVEEEED